MRSGRASDRRSDDAGFTLAELMVALGVFSILAVISGAAMLSVMSGIRTVSASTEIQVEAQNSAVWVSRLLRYAAIPPGSESAFLSADQQSLVFHTWAGAGPTPDSPYRARLGVITAPDGAQQLISDVAPGRLQDGEWAWSGNWIGGSLQEPPSADSARRVLLEVGSGQASPVEFTVWACRPAEGCEATARNVTPAAPAAISLNEGERLFAVDIVLGRTDDPLSAVTQRINLVNLAGRL